jgi:hypothetical protein
MEDRGKCVKAQRPAFGKWNVLWMYR